MFRNRQVRVVAAVVCVAVQCSSTASWGAGWMSDWTNRISSNGAGPSYMNGQARGYLSGGSYSARWPVSQNNNVLSVAPPKLSAGCGGINFYSGSISFLKPDMLVKKLQNVLQNSAGVAFQMALDTLCPKCATIVAGMEDLSNKLNAMSMDDCNAAKGLVTGVRDAATDFAENVKESGFKTAVSEGFTDSYEGARDAVGESLDDLNEYSNSKFGQASGTLARYAGCPADIKVLFPSDPSKYPVSVLDAVGQSMSLPASQTELLRGLAGDIKIGSFLIAGNPVDYVRPCTANSAYDTTDVITGHVQKMDAMGVCTDVAGSDTTMQTCVSEKFQTVMSALSTKTALTAADVAFVSSMPTAVLYGMRVAIMTGQQSSLAPMLVDSAAAGLSMKALKDLMTRYEEILAYMHGTGRLSDNASNCQLGAVSKSLEPVVKEARENIDKVYRGLNESYTNSLQEVTTSFTINNRLQELDAQLKTVVARTFGASVAQRAMRSL